MSTFPNYPASAAPEQFADGPPPVQVAVAQVMAQRRVTVFFRVFMLIPHFFVLYLLGIAAGVVTFLGWWAALFTGWLPDFAVSYLSGYVRWYTRVTAQHQGLRDLVGVGGAVAWAFEGLKTKKDSCMVGDWVSSPSPANRSPCAILPVLR